MPQNFALVKQAEKEGFEWVSFKTNDRAKVNQLAGRVSYMRALPKDVIANSYQISREQARRLKYNREEATLFAPWCFRAFFLTDSYLKQPGYLLGQSLKQNLK